MISIQQAIKDYVWRGGTFIAIRDIGPYEFVEYWNKPAPNVEDQRRYRLFGAYIDGKRTGCCYHSLDAALAGCIAMRHEGMNGRADAYFMKMLNVADEPEFEADHIVSLRREA